VTKILSGTPYKMFVVSKEREKASNRRGKAEQSQKRPEAAQKKEESGGLKRKNRGGVGNGTKIEPFHAIYLKFFMNRLCRMWRYSRIAGSRAEYVRNGDMRTVPVGKVVVASCATTVKLEYICTLP
jgi:hypothetical protein